MPVEYTIGNIDPRYNISQDELKKTAYVEKADAKLKINLIYDDRQKKLDGTKAQIAAFDSSLGSIEEFRAKLESISTQYQNDLNQYNSNVAYWNSRGGAPANIYDQLNTVRNNLEKNALRSIKSQVF